MASLRRWVMAITDDRKRDYRTHYGWFVDATRNVLNTAEDVEARAAGHLANRYWDTKDRTGKRVDLEAMVAREGNV